MISQFSEALYGTLEKGLLQIIPPFLKEVAEGPRILMTSRLAYLELLKMVILKLPKTNIIKGY